MPEDIFVHEARIHLSRPLDKAHAGEEIVLGKAGKPCARLVPQEARSVPERALGFLEGFHLDESFFDPLPADELARWEGRGE